MLVVVVVAMMVMLVRWLLLLQKEELPDELEDVPLTHGSAVLCHPLFLLPSSLLAAASHSLPLFLSPPPPLLCPVDCFTRLPSSVSADLPHHLVMVCLRPSVAGAAEFDRCVDELSSSPYRREEKRGAEAGPPADEHGREKASMDMDDELKFMAPHALGFEADGSMQRSSSFSDFAAVFDFQNFQQEVRGLMTSWEASVVVFGVAHLWTTLRLGRPCSAKLGSGAVTDTPLLLASLSISCSPTPSHVLRN